MLSLGVALVEQPLPADDDARLAQLHRPLPVCADEACHDRLVAQGAQFADLDGPLLLERDRTTPMQYEGSLMHPASRKLWG